VSRRLGSRYRSGRSPDWLRFKNSEAPAVKREAEEDWGMTDQLAAASRSRFQVVIAPQRRRLSQLELTSPKRSEGVLCV
jgi:hypothetical protein